ncbi:Uncharacterised protein [Mycobacteroides abscessus subsp. abscessus]|nr:Uncharacterised protein [Mycobacteroides abscessus subsp. abscessus]
MEGISLRPSRRSTSSTRSAPSVMSGRQLGGVTRSVSPSTTTPAPIWRSRRSTTPSA